MLAVAYKSPVSDGQRERRFEFFARRAVDETFGDKCIVDQDEERFFEECRRLREGDATCDRGLGAPGGAV